MINITSGRLDCSSSPSLLRGLRRQRFISVKIKYGIFFLDTLTNSSSDSGRFTMTTLTIMPIAGRLRARKSLFQLHFMKSLSLSVVDLSFQPVNGHDEHQH